MAISVKDKEISSAISWYWLQLSRRKQASITAGFTLIELVVVLIIIGILSAIALPNIIATVGKGREAEAKKILSTLGRSQQAYFSENGQFADTIAKLDTNVEGKYYNFPDPTTSTSPEIWVKHDAQSIAADANNTREYQIGVYFENQGYISILCQSDAPGGAVESPNVGTGATACTQGKLLK